MKKATKLISLLLITALMMSTIGMSTVTAASEAVFTVSQVSDSGTSTKLKVSLESGTPNSFDIEFIFSSNIKSCKAINFTEAYRNFRNTVEENNGNIVGTANASTKKISVASTVALTAMDIFEVELVKTSNAPLNVKDVQMTVPSCATTQGGAEAVSISTKVNVNLPKLAGSCGSSAYYIYDESAKNLKIYGSGELTNFASTSTVPWNSAMGDITTVTVADGITSISNNAFNGAKLLKSINIPASVTAIGKSAFKNCTALTELTLDKTVTTVGEDAFGGCTKLVIKCRFGYAAYKYVVDKKINFELLDSYVIGDVNTDKYINSNDALQILRYAVGEISFSTQQRKTGDVNGDGKLNSIDALYVLEISIGTRDALKYQR